MLKLPTCNIRIILSNKLVENEHKRILGSIYQAQHSGLSLTLFSKLPSFDAMNISNKWTNTKFYTIFEQSQQFLQCTFRRIFPMNSFFQCVHIFFSNKHPMPRKQLPFICLYSEFITYIVN